jgi:CTD nuclear envelope phosphatase 1
MNSAISILGRSPTPTTSRSRSSSYVGIEVVDRKTASAEHDTTSDANSQMDFTEESPLLGQKPFGDVSSGGWASYPQRISSGIVGTVRVVLTAITAPARYVLACFYDDEGHFSIMYPIITVARTLNPRKRRRGVEIEALSSEKAASGHSSSKARNTRRPSKTPSTTISASSAVYSDSELDEKAPEGDSPARHTRSKSNSSTEGDEIAPQRRSIRIKLHNEEALKKRRTQQAQDARTKVSDAKDLVAASLKSPSSPLSSSTLKLTKFPRAPHPPRPLIPRRQPSYSKAAPQDLRPRQKTLVIDLDETLIHSQSKGGRFATGHMIEVKMSHSVGVGGVTLGPQVPILYYVHKRPHCDEFLRKVRIRFKTLYRDAS